MGTFWLKNFTGIGLADEQLEIVPHALTELGIHITFKTVQAGTLLGSAIGAVVALSKKEDVKATVVRYGKYGIVIGFIVGPLMTVSAMRGKSTPEIVDRCFRLRHNAGQLFTDRAVTLAAIAGLAHAGHAGLIAGINGALLLSPVARAVLETLFGVDKKF